MTKYETAKLTLICDVLCQIDITKHSTTQLYQEITCSIFIEKYDRHC